MRYRILASLISSLIATSAQSAIIDFNAATPTEYATVSYEEDGFRLDVLQGHYDIWGTGTCNINNPCTSNYLGVDGNFGPLSTVRLTVSGGGQFNLYSLFVLSASESGANCNTACTVTSSNGGVVPFMPHGVMTFSGAQWRDLSWVDFFAGQFFGPELFAFGAATIDDVNVAAVPTPPAVWLFGSALGVMGWMRRKSARTTAEGREFESLRARIEI